MSKVKTGFNEWIDSILGNFDLDAKAFCFNIYESESEGEYSIELTAFDECDEDDDWCSGGSEIYASRNDDNEYKFSAKGDWKKCLKIVKKLLTVYIKKGQYAEKLKQSEVVAYGFVDGDLETAYKKQLTRSSGISESTHGNGR